ncbi:MAG: hypothetical protein LBN12_03890 [Clostridiales Family XIII bacterium]|jgi:uncharacterized membrane protein YgcG|nr:hypothetical protein [Clostridiales Family XIII bacterium]
MASSAKTRDINLLLAMDRQKSSAQKGKGVGIVIPIVVIVLVAVGMGAGYSYFYSNTSEVKAMKKTIELYLDDPATQAAYNESLTAKSESERMTAEMSALRDVILNISSYPDLQGGDIEQILETAGSNVRLEPMSYDKATGVLLFGATGKKVTDVPLFIAQLRITGIFADVQYTGYATNIGYISKQVWDDGIWDYREEQIPFEEYHFGVTALVNAQTPYLPPSIGGPAYSPDGNTASPGEGGAAGGGSLGGGSAGGGSAGGGK